MKLINVKIVGTTAVLQHRFGDHAEVDGEQATRRVNNKPTTPREQAESVCYRDADQNLVFPAPAIVRLLREAGAQHKQKGTRKSVKYIVPAAVVMQDEFINFIDKRTGKKVANFEVDSRPVVIPSTKGRVMRHRPRLDEWAAAFAIRVNDNVLPVAFIHQLLVEGGEQIGIGDFRPEKGGPFGTFQVSLWHPTDWKLKSTLPVEEPEDDDDKPILPPKPKAAESTQYRNRMRR